MSRGLVHKFGGSTPLPPNSLSGTLRQFLPLSCFDRSSAIAAYNCALHEQSIEGKYRHIDTPSFPVELETHAVWAAHPGPFRNVRFHARIFGWRIKENAVDDRVYCNKTLQNKSGPVVIRTRDLRRVKATS